MKYKIYNQDVIEWAKEYQKGKFHALISDAPYHLTSIVKRFGKKDSAPAQFGTDGVFSRSSKGFMGQEWDGGDVAFRPETWEAICEHLYPGAFGMVFSASRNWHRLAVAIEDAGMIIHPTIFGWLNGQGFPKATNISKQIDKNLGLERPTGKLITNGHGRSNLKVDLRKQGDTGVGHWDGNHKVYNETLPASDMSARWEGHRYGLQALKPAVEPIIVFQKPYEGRPLDNIVATGAGAINIDGGRIGIGELIPGGGNGKASHGGKWASGEYEGTRPVTQPRSNGRWPANFILDDSSADRLDAQTGILTSGKMLSTQKRSTDGSPNGIYGRFDINAPLQETIGDSGGASRFFYNVQEQIDEADPIYYCSKVSPKERNAGLDDRCVHPTMKPIALAKYLATLLLPPEGYAPRRILVPFSGVGSEMVGCIHAGWEHIVGIEFMEEYVELAEKRIEYWKDKK